NGAGFGVEAAGFRKRPELTARLEYEIFPVGSPATATFVRWFVPALEQAMQAGSVRGRFPNQLPADSTGGLRRIKTQMAAVGCPHNIQDVALHGQQLARLRPICLGQEHVTQAGVNQRIAVGRPGRGFSNSVGESARRASQNRQAPQRPLWWR